MRRLSEEQVVDIGRRRQLGFPQRQSFVLQPGLAAERHTLEMEILRVLRVRGVTTLQHQADRGIEAVVAAARLGLDLFLDGRDLAFGDLGRVLGRGGARLGALNALLQRLNLLRILLLHLLDHALEFGDVGRIGRKGAHGNAQRSHDGGVHQCLLHLYFSDALQTAAPNKRAEKGKLYVIEEDEGGARPR